MDTAAKASQDAAADNFNNMHANNSSSAIQNDDVTIPLKQNANFELYDVNNFFSK